MRGQARIEVCLLPYAWSLILMVNLDSNHGTMVLSEQWSSPVGHSLLCCHRITAKCTPIPTVTVGFCKKIDPDRTGILWNITAPAPEQHTSV